jgi:ribosomal protein S18 acetylase RimI-like enzyme
MAKGGRMTIPERVGEPREVDYSGQTSDFGPLARDRIPVRSMKESDLKALVNIDRRITGRDRTRYFERKLADAMHESDIRISLVAEADGVPVGFIMARVDLGEYGRSETAAVMDTVGVDPDYRDHGVGRALLSQLLANLSTLRVEKLLTEVDWSDRQLMAFLDHCGFTPSPRLCFNLALA